jgi:DNA-binding LacI/PurR family transcriptional regulator
MRERPSEPKRLTVARPLPAVGLFINGLEPGYAWSLVRGAADAARVGGANLLCFAGGVLGAPPGSGGERNSVFELATPATVDGLIVASGAIGNRLGRARLEQYCERYRPLHICSVAAELTGASFVSIDNESGMRTAIDHLVNVHAMRKIAFVRGPETNPEAERRYVAYKEALRHADIPFAPELVAAGDFDEHSGRHAVHTFFSTPGVSAHTLDAIVAANDEMALGALAELTRLGVRVPEQVAVVGFDDIEESRFSLPPLTTVRQPLLEQGRDAVRMVLHQIRLGGAPERVVRLTEPIVRRSCGCLGAQHAAGPPSSESHPRSSFEAAFVERRQLILAALARAARGQLSAAGADWPERLLNAFADQMRGQAPSALLHAFDDTLRRLSAGDVDLSICHDVVSALRISALGSLDGDPHRRSQAEDLFHAVRVMIAEATDRAHASRRIRQERAARALGQAAAAIAACRDLEELSSAVAAHLPALDIARCFLAVLSEESSPEQPLYRLILALHPGLRGTAPSSDPRPFAEIVRKEVLTATGEHTFAVLPLSYGARMRAVVVIEIGAPDGWAYEMLRDAFTAFLRARER